MIKAYRRTSFRYDFIRENHEKEINFSFKFVSQEGKDKKKPHFKGLNLHFEFFNIKNEKFEDEETQSLYNTLTEMKSDYTVISREVPNAISRKAYAFYDQVRSHQQEWQARANAGEDIDEIVDEAMNILKSLS